MYRILRSLFDDPTFHVTSRFGLFDGEGDEGGGGEGGAGSGGEGDGSQSEAEHAAAQQAGGQGQQQRQAGGSQRDKWIPKYRFDEVNTRFNAYKAFGQPQEIQAKLARLAELEQLPQNRYNEKQTAEIRQDLLRVFPEIQSVVSAHQNQSTSFVSHGARQNETFMKELGVEVNEANNLSLQDVLAGVISRNPELSQRFFARDGTVFADAFKAAKTVFWPNLKRTVPGLQKVQTKTPASPGPNANGKGKPAVEEEITPGPLYERQILDKASEAAFARISEQME